MHIVYSQIKIHNDINWIDYFILLKYLSKAVRDKDKQLIEKYLIITVYQTLCFSKQNNIDIMSSWNRWKLKIDYKNYF